MKTNYKILIIETSDIVITGIKGEMKLSNLNVSFTSVFSLQNALDIPAHKKFDLIITNPIIFNNCLDAFNKFSSHFKQVTVIGLITTYYDRNLCNHFSDCIHLNDNKRIIITTITKHLTLKDDNNTKSEETSLTERETDILKLLVIGKSNKEIADCFSPLESRTEL